MTTMAHQKADFSDSEEEWDIEAYFSKPYVPLSNLPTPPLSANSLRGSRPHTPDSEFDHDEAFDPELLGPAIHLTNLIPPATSLTPPSSHLIHAILVGAALPSSTLALAAIILDSLTSRFALSWRRALSPILQPTLNHIPKEANIHLSKRHSISDPKTKKQPLAIDDLRPELVALSALILARKFLNDSESSSVHYAGAWGGNLWTVEQINAAQNVLCENLDWRILPLCEAHLIAEAEETMKRVGESARRERTHGENTRTARRFTGPTLVKNNVIDVGSEKEPVRIHSTEFLPAYGMDWD